MVTLSEAPWHLPALVKPKEITAGPLTLVRLTSEAEDLSRAQGPIEPYEESKFVLLFEKGVPDHHLKCLLREGWCPVGHLIHAPSLKQPPSSAQVSLDLRLSILKSRDSVTCLRTTEAFAPQMLNVVLDKDIELGMVVRNSPAFLSEKGPEALRALL